jgi:hypothetical protein
VKIQSATEIRISLSSLKRPPQAAGALQVDSIVDDARWEIMTQSGGSTVGRRDRVSSWLSSIRGQTWDSETVFFGETNALCHGEILIIIRFHIG